MKYLNALSIIHEHKGIPYGGLGEVRDDGEANYGFKETKNNPEVINSIPELVRDEALKELILSINFPTTSLFSIGCTSSPVLEKDGHRYTGYIEFAVNSIEEVQDAFVYFPIFFHFEKFLHKSKFETPISFDWELMPGYFLEHSVGGYTCSIYINTGYFPSERDAYEAWEKALSTLASYLQNVEGIGGRKIY